MPPSSAPNFCVVVVLSISEAIGKRDREAFRSISEDTSEFFCSDKSPCSSQKHEIPEYSAEESAGWNARAGAGEGILREDAADEGDALLGCREPRLVAGALTNRHCR